MVILRHLIKLSLRIKNFVSPQPFQNLVPTKKTPGRSDLLKREDYRGFGCGLVGLGWVVFRCRLVRGCWSISRFVAWVVLCAKRLVRAERPAGRISSHTSPAKLRHRDVPGQGFSFWDGCFLFGFGLDLCITYSPDQISP